MTRGHGVPAPGYPGQATETGGPSKKTSPETLAAQTPRWKGDLAGLLGRANALLEWAFLEADRHTGC